jgi:hypothetical protein
MQNAIPSELLSKTAEAKFKDDSNPQIDNAIL